MGLLVRVDVMGEAAPRSWNSARVRVSWDDFFFPGVEAIDFRNRMENSYSWDSGRVIYLD